MLQETLSPLGSCPEAEKALASIAITSPNEFMVRSNELGFSKNMILHEVYREVVSAVMDRAVAGSECDAMLVYTDISPKLRHVKFSEISDIETSCPIISALPEFISKVRKAFIRRELQQKLANSLQDAQGAIVLTEKIISDVQASIEDLTKNVISVKSRDTSTLLAEALDRYENGEDRSTLIGTGFSSLDDITPIRYGDFLIIGGEPKAGKTTLALNFIAAMILRQQNEDN